VTSLTSQRYWRTPLDAAEIPRRRGTLSLIEERCKGCSYCVDFCPRDVFARSERYNTKGYHPPDVVKPEQCVACRLCELLCPEFALIVEECGSGPEVNDAC
jgi:2-oxoglutarate ferredoxin oxidoreductase subunit delta